MENLKRHSLMVACFGALTLSVLGLGSAPTAALDATSQQAAANPTQLQILYRMSAVLTGTDPTDAQKQALTSGKATLEQLADAMRATPAFEARLRNYWQQQLKITAPVQFGDIFDTSAPVYGGYMSLFNYITGNFSDPQNMHSATWVQNGCGTIYDFPWPLSCSITNVYDYAPTCFDSQTNSYSQTDCSNVTTTTPYWNKNETINVEKGLLDPAICGPDLHGCFPDATTPYASARDHVNPDPNNPTIDRIRTSLTLEPGEIIAHIVMEDKPWDQVLLTSQGMGNGAFLDFVGHWNKVLDHFMPPGSLPGRTTDPTITNANVDDLSFHWYERGPANAGGVMTTIAFHDEKNGERAKAHNIMNAFLCKEFVFPTDIPSVASDNWELEQKNGCSVCHATLEPMAKMFEHYPHLGTPNYYYNNDPSLTAAGEFNGQPGTGVAGFGQIVTSMDDYYSCAVQNAFNFLVGRPMNAKETQTMLKPMTSELEQNGKITWPIYQEIMRSPSFTGAAQAP